MLFLVVGGRIASWFVAGALVAASPCRIGKPPRDLNAVAFTSASDSGSTIAGWHTKPADCDGVVVLLHSIRGSRLSMLERARLLHAEGFATVMIDLQAHGESPGDSITLGHLEKHDVRAAVEFARREHPTQPVGVIGVSLGGAAALLASPLDIDALVIESVYPARTGAYRTSSGRTMLHTDERTTANVVADAGYVTGMVGKWHLGDNAPHGPYRVAPEWGDPYKNTVKWKSGAEFHGRIANLDHTVGLLRTRLAELGIAENTILIFMTDNGTAQGIAGSAVEPDDYKGFNAGMRGVKSTVYEGGHRVPCFVRWPAGNLEGGRDASNLAAHIDVLPRLAELCGIDLPDSLKLDGRPFAAQLKDPSAPPHGDHYITQLHGGARFVHKEHPWDTSCVVKDRWRLFDDKGDAGGAYFTEVELLSSADKVSAYRWSAFKNRFAGRAWPHEPGL